jgi:hypothetical protein
MPCQCRIECEETFHHVLIRQDRKQASFPGGADRHDFSKLWRTLATRLVCRPWLLLDDNLIS